MALINRGSPLQKGCLISLTGGRHRPTPRDLGVLFKGTPCSWVSPLIYRVAKGYMATARVYRAALSLDEPILKRIMLKAAAKGIGYDRIKSFK